MKNIINCSIKILLVVIISSCSKEDLYDLDEEMEDSMSSKYYMKFKVDGKAIEYRGVDDENMEGFVTEVKSKDGYYMAQVVGDKLPSLSTRNSLSITISHSTPFVVNTIYGTSNSQVAGAIKSALLALGYTDDAGNVYLSSLMEGFPPPFDTQLEFTEITKNGIKGRFSGTLHLLKETEAIKTIKITDGEFYVKRI